MKSDENTQKENLEKNISEKKNPEKKSSVVPLLNSALAVVAFSGVAGIFDSLSGGLDNSLEDIAFGSGVVAGLANGESPKVNTTYTSLVALATVSIPSFCNTLYSSDFSTAIKQLAAKGVVYGMGALIGVVLNGYGKKDQKAILEISYLYNEKEKADRAYDFLLKLVSNNQEALDINPNDISKPKQTGECDYILSTQILGSLLKIEELHSCAKEYFENQKTYISGTISKPLLLKK